jgi:subtilisin family serine protease
MRNNIFRTLLKAIVCLIVIFSLTVNSYSQKTPIKSNIIRVKFTKEMTSTLQSFQSKKIQTSKAGYVVTGISSFDKLATKYKAVTMERIFRPAGKFEARHRKYGLHLWYELKFDKPTTSEFRESINEFKKLPEVEVADTVSEKKLYGENSAAKGEQLSFIPNDPLFSQQWHYRNTGQTGGTPGSDIKLVDAWDIQKGSDNVIVAVIDMGIDIHHADLADAMWVNEAERDGVTGVDDDDNGYIDDINGYCFGDNSGTIPAGDHATHVGGTIGAITGNGIGVSGIAGGSGSADGVRLMSCAAFGDFGAGGFDDAFVYAADMGAIIAQNSWGYIYEGVYEQSLLDAIDYFIDNAGVDIGGNQTGPMAGGIVIFAAGNDDDNGEYYPGYYEPVLAVSSINHNSQKSYYSNYGDWVDVAAPGGETNSVEEQGVLSTFPGNSYGFLQGTSMACPHVSGVAALVVSEFGGDGFTPQFLRDRLVQTTDNIDAQNPGYIGMLGSGLINAANALLPSDTIPPGAIDDLSATDVSPITVTLSWTATGGSGSDGRASSYDLRYAEFAISEANFESAIRVNHTPSPKLSGESEIFEITGLIPSTTYYFAIKAIDIDGYKSDISNIIEVITDPAPVISVNPTELNESLNKEQTVIDTLVLRNVRDGILEFSFPAFEISYSSINNTSYIPFSKNPGKNEKDTRVGHPVISGKGDDGPDGFGYRWIDSDEPNGPDFDWNDISSIGTELDLGDDGYQYVTLPFEFDFYGLTYTGGYISANGFFTFDPSAPYSCSNEQIPSTNSPNALIAAFWDDLYPYEGYVYYYGNAENFIVQYTDVPILGSGGSLTFQIILNHNGNIKFQYLDMAGTLTYATTGIENEDGADGLQIAFNTEYVHDNLAVLISSKPDFISSITPVSGSVNSGDSLEVLVAITSHELAPDNYESVLEISSNDPSHPELLVPVYLHVNGTPAISVVPESLHYGEVFITDTAELSLTLYNTGTDSLRIDNITSINNLFLVKDFQPSAFYSNDSIIIDVLFIPETESSEESDLTIYSNAANDNEYVIHLTGIGVLPPVIAVSPDSFDVALFTGDTLIELLTVSNAEGNSTLNYTVEINNQSEADASVSRDKSNDIVRTALAPEETAAGYVPPVSVNAAGNKQIPYTDGFESGNFNDWFDDPSTGTKEVVNSTSASGQYSFHYNSQSASGHFHGIHQEFIAGNQPEFISFSVRSGSTSTYDGYFVMTSNDNEVIWFSAGGDGYFYVNGDVGGDRSFDYNANEWYLIEFRNIDWTDKDFDYYVNGQLIKADIPMRNALFVNDITNLYLNNYDSYSEAWWDNINIGNACSWLSTNVQSGSIPAGSSAILQLLFDATDMFGGDYSAEVDISSNDPVNPQITVPALMHVTGAPVLNVSTDTILFGQVFTGYSDSASIVISNNGTDLLIIDSLYTDNSKFEVEYDSISVNYQTSAELKVWYNAGELQIDQGYLYLVSNDSDNTPKAIYLSAESVLPPVMEVSPDSFDVALFTGDTLNEHMTISNVEGNSTLNFEISISQMRTSNTRSLASLDRYKNLIPEVKPYKQKLSGAHPFSTTKNYTVTSASSGKLFAVDMSSGSIIEIDPESGEVMDIIYTPDNFPWGPEGLAFDGKYLYYSEQSGNIIRIDYKSKDYIDALNTGLTIDALGFGNNKLYVQEYDNAIYELDYATGIITDTIIVPYMIWGGMTFGGERGTIFSSFSGGIIEIDIATKEIVGFIECAYTIYGLSYSNDLNLLFVADIDYGEIHAINPDDGSTQYSFSGYASALAGDEYSGSGWIESQIISGSVDAGDTLDIPIKFSAEGMFGGNYSSIITVSSNDPVTPEVQVPAHMHVTGAPVINVNPNLLNFGQVFSGYSDTLIVTISNDGTDDLIIDSIYTDNSRFTLEYNELPLDPGESNELTVWYHAETAQLDEGSLYLLSNDTDKTPLMVSLSGESVLPPVMRILPDSFHVELDINETTSGIMTIDNMEGGCELHVTIDKNYLEAPEFIESDIAINNSWTDNSIAKANYPIRNKKLIPALSNIHKNADAIKVLVLHNYWDNVYEIVDLLNAYPDLDVSAQNDDTLNLQELMKYETIIICNDWYWNDPVGLGNMLADYVDAGGNLIITPYVFHIDYGLAGRLVNEYYMPVYKRFNIGYDYFQNINSDHPVMEGVNSISSQNVVIDLDARTDAEEIVTYSNYGGTCVAIKGNVTAINVFIAQSGYWAGDVPGLFHNAIIWRSSLSIRWLTLETSQADIAEGDFEEISVDFYAADLEFGDYYASITVEGNDPANPVENVPVHMRVAPKSAIEEDPIQSGGLLCNYPNPFSDITNITYSLDEPRYVEIRIYDLQGELLRTLVNAVETPGNKTLEFNANGLDPGVYIYKLSIDGNTFGVNRMIVK